jgi:hypothetical protein
MNLFERLLPHLVFLAALMPTLVLLVAGLVSVAFPDPVPHAPVPAAMSACLACEDWPGGD